MLKKFTINQLLFISHLILVMILVAGMSVARYQSEWDTRVAHEVALAEKSLTPLMTDISAAVAGRNYAALLMPSFLETLKNNRQLLFLDIQGASDYSSHAVAVRYLQSQGVIWRTDVTAEEIQKFSDHQAQLTASLETEVSDPVKRKKLMFLLNKTKGELHALETGKKLTQSVALPWSLPDAVQKYNLLSRDRVMIVQLPLLNKNGGVLKAVFDAAPLYSLKGQIYRTIFVEGSIALLASLLVIVAVTHWLVSPLRRLASRINQDIEGLDISDLEELKRQDEIGVLARGLHSLTEKTQSQLKLLRHLSDTDALTGLAGRHNYDRRAGAFYHTARIMCANFGLIACDIDHFKQYNDTFGHVRGDEVIKKIADVLRNTTRKNDLCFRIGGEEFVALVHVDDMESLQRITERMRTGVEGMGIPHVTQHGVVTLSIGAVLIEPSTSHWRYSDLFNLADEQLYLAKDKGRNRVELARVEASRKAPEREGDTSATG